MGSRFLSVFKTIMCPIHAPKTIPSEEIMEDKAVVRKVWIHRDEIKQIQEYVTFSSRWRESQNFFLFQLYER